VALSKPKAKVVVFDGDGAALMGLGNLPAIGTLSPANLIHVVFDNEAFASTGNQPTYSGSVALDRLAAAAGYRQVGRAGTAEELEREWVRISGGTGPAFLLVKCRPDEGPPAERVRLEPEAITQRFMEAVHAS
jgi:phosphonopyruvate decarboxylase